MRAEEEVTLSTIGGGALAELFGAEMERVLANIQDPNTDDKQKRTITIQVVFSPGRDRTDSAVEIKCNSKLAGIRGVNTVVFLGKRQGRLIAVENDPRQSNMFDDERTMAQKVAATVTPIRKDTE